LAFSYTKVCDPSATVEWWLSGVPDVYHCVKREKVGVARVGYRGGMGGNWRDVVPLLEVVELSDELGECWLGYLSVLTSTRHRLRKNGQIRGAQAGSAVLHLYPLLGSFDLDGISSSP
jgi:hypothetical protein